MATIRVTEIAEILSVSHRRAGVIARGAGFRRWVGQEGRSRLWDRREVTGVGA